MKDYIPEIHIIKKGGELFTTSIDVAEKFGKGHNLVLRAIRKIISDCSTEPVCKKDHGSKSRSHTIPAFEGLDFAERNFRLISYLDENNQRRPMYEMTRSGFAVLAMGFTGKKALVWKIKFEQAFSLMEKKILNQNNLSWQASRQQGKLSRREETDTIADFIEYAAKQGSNNGHHYYKHLTNATYKALFIITDKYPDNFRDMLNTAQLSFLATAEHVAAKALLDGMAQGLFYKEIFILAKTRLIALADSVGATRVIVVDRQLRLPGVRTAGKKAITEARA